MTPTQMARRSDALYADGTCGMTRRVLCNMVAQRESDLEDARAESAKLRSQCADLVDERERLFRANVEKNGEVLRLVGENVKLREFAHDLLQPILADGFDCYGCVHEDCDGMQYTDRCKLLDQARELGIEV